MRQVRFATLPERIDPANQIVLADDRQMELERVVRGAESLERGLEPLFESEGEIEGRDHGRAPPSLASRNCSNAREQPRASAPSSRPSSSSRSPTREPMSSVWIRNGISSFARSA